MIARWSVVATGPELETAFRGLELGREIGTALAGEARWKYDKMACSTARRDESLAPHHTGAAVA